MTSGDPGAVRKMHEVLHSLQQLGMINLTPDQIRGQLEREYRVTLGSAPSSGGDFGALPTQQELLEELQFAQQRDRLTGVPEDRTGDVAEELSDDEDSMVSVVGSNEYGSNEAGIEEVPDSEVDDEHEAEA